MRAKDIIEIENLQGRYMHLLISGNFEEVIELFSNLPDTSFHIGKREPYIGKQEIYEKMFLTRMIESFPEYDRFHAGGQNTAAYIDVDEKGERGFGMFPSFGFFVRGKIFGYDKPPYPVPISCGMWYHEFVKENGAWKIHHFHTGTLIEAEAWKWNPYFEEGYAELEIARKLPAPPGRE